MPSFYGIGEGKVKSEASKLASLIRYLNDSAISRKETFPLKFNLDTKDINWKTPEGEKLERFESLFDVSATSTGTVSDGEITLFFGPLGLQENLSITLKDSKNELTVSFNPLSGRVKVMKNETYMSPKLSGHKEG